MRSAARTARPAFLQNVSRAPRRGYSSEAGSGGAKSNTGIYFGAAIVAATGAGAFYYYNNREGGPLSAAGAKSVFKPAKEDYQKVYDYIAQLLVEKDDYDDGSYGPVLVRLAWHASGTYDAATGTGGSNGATMRFAPEGGHGANAGLKHARDFLEPVKGMSDPVPSSSHGS